MPELIDFLEHVGQDARLRYAGRAQLESELAAIGIENEAQAALLDGDTARLEAALGVKANVCCLIEVPDEYM